MLMIHKFLISVMICLNCIIMRLQADLVTANSWFCSNNLMVNPEKGTAMWLGRCRDAPSFFIESNVICNL